MNETFAQGLIISAIGMSMVFAALAGLWALIALLGRLHMPGWLRLRSHDAGTTPELDQSEQIALPTADELAAIATALALLHAEDEAEAALRWRLPPLLTRWVAVGYGRHLTPWQPPRGRHGNS
jgi:Na+-transporting methylmalonyl-CoA/oxaloacetate decarboxylase gamma subunit